tara:strand:+ start:880 stop:1212 length:333 start_codon:yes stop_codon:yes gene_type:complete
MSVQAHDGAYCEPRDDRGPWYEVEVGYPNAEEFLLMDYVEDASRPTDTVYAYVPVSLIEQVIEKHGGTNAEGTHTMTVIKERGRDQLWWSAKLQAAFNEKQKELRELQKL